MEKYLKKIENIPWYSTQDRFNSFSSSVFPSQRESIKKRKRDEEENFTRIRKKKKASEIEEVQEMVEEIQEDLYSLPKTFSFRIIIENQLMDGELFLKLSRTKQADLIKEVPPHYVIFFFLFLKSTSLFQK